LKPNAPEQGEPEERFDHSVAYGSDFKWKPLEGQEAKFMSLAQQFNLVYQSPQIVPSNVPLFRLGAGQRFHAIIYARVGTQLDHVKFSPIAAPLYRQLPYWDVSHHLTLAELEKLAFKDCPGKVFDIEDFQLRARRPWDCTLCRQCTEDPEYAGQIRMTFSRRDFLFAIESNGALPAREYFFMLLELDQ
jgi:DNA-directed RNA polymerase alpha subunit